MILVVVAAAAVRTIKPRIIQAITVKTMVVTPGNAATVTVTAVMAVVPGAVIITVVVVVVAIAMTDDKKLNIIRYHSASI